MITRGTTVSQSFALPFDVDQISEIYITYVQRGEVILEKTKYDLHANKEAKIIKVNLSQEDTLSFHPLENSKDPNASLVLIQIRILLSDGQAIVSNVMRDRIYDILKGGTIEEEPIPVPDDGVLIYDGGGVEGW